MPKLLGIKGRPETLGGTRLKPMTGYGLTVMSIGFLVAEETPMIWRGPMVMSALTQMLREVEWGTLDVMVVDMPPGTGDAQLSLVQATMVHGAIIVTTPQEVASGDALRGAKMFQRVAVPVLGVIENMSYFVCPNCSEQHRIFGAGGGKRLADELDVPLLGEVPFFPAVLSGGDTGEPIVVGAPDSLAAKAIIDLAGKLGGLL
jgi:ATP-binding protein involved in chromosome partitioning